jgi:hypothetical protein
MDLERWLIDDLGYTAEEAKELAAKLAAKADKISGQITETKTLKKLQADLDANNEKLNADLAEFASLSAAEQSKATKLQADIEAAQTKAFQLEQRLTRVAEEYGLDPKTLLVGEPTPEPKKKEPAPVDLKPLSDQIAGSVAYTDYWADVYAELPLIADEHFKLTGERFDQRAFVAGIKADLKANKTENLNPQKRWETQFQIQEKRAAASKKEYDAAIASAREEGRLAALSEGALPQNGQTGKHAPIFRSPDIGKGSKLPEGQRRPQPSGRLSGAIAALAQRKYLPKVGGTVQ